MSARQRHSRQTNDDGWTVISAAFKKGSKNGAAKAKAKLEAVMKAHRPVDEDAPITGDGKEEEKLDGAGGGGGGEEGIASSTKDDPEPTEADIKAAKVKLESYIEKYNSTPTPEKVKALIRRILNLDPSVETSSPSPAPKITRLLVVALGSVTNPLDPNPPYQLGALLTILSILRPYNPSLEVLHYDPVTTKLDTHLLTHYGIRVLPNQREIPGHPNPHLPDAGNWFQKTMIYIPHGVIWLNHRYLLKQPAVYIGNNFSTYEGQYFYRGDNWEDERSGGLKDCESVEEREMRAKEARRKGVKIEWGKSEVEVVLDDVRSVLDGKDGKGYETVEWPDVKWGDGIVFNETVVYVRKDVMEGYGGDGVEKSDEGKERVEG